MSPIYRHPPAANRGKKRHRPKSGPLWLCLALLIPALCAVPANAGENPTYHLVILHSNDFHGADPMLLARRAGLIKRIRSQERHVLVLEAGDVWTRGHYAGVFYGEMEFAAMNLMGYDAMTLGNNEFKATADETAQAYLAARLKQAAFPILCANVTLAGDARPLPGTQPYLIKQVDGMKVGIMGLSSPKIGGYRQARGFAVEDPLVCAAALAPKLAGEADIAIALTHIGLGEDMALAKKLPVLTAIIGGDSHTLLTEPVLVKGVPIVQAGSGGSYLGRLDLDLVRRGQHWRLQNAGGRLIRLDRTQPSDAEVRKAVQGYLARAAA